MTETQTPSEQIVAAVTDWPGLEVGPGMRGAQVAFHVGRREIGHLHGDRVFHTFFAPAVWTRLRAEGRISEHPVFPGRQGPAARALNSQDDIDDVVALLRLNYERRIDGPDAAA